MINNSSIAGAEKIEAQDIILDYGETYTIPKGEHDGTGTVAAKAYSNEGAHIKEDEYTCWKYGTMATQNTYVGEPTVETWSTVNTKNPAASVTSSTVLYTGFDYSNGVIHLNGGTTPKLSTTSYNNYYCEMRTDTGLIVFKLSDSANSSQYPCLVYAKERYTFSNVTMSGDITYLGHAYSSNSSAYPDDGVQGSYYYTKKSDISDW